MKLHNRELTFRAKQLRKNMTKEERHLWFDFLKDYPIKFQAQKVIGDYIVDFFCFKARLAIELDGDQHYFKNIKEYDFKRTYSLSQFGIDVLRFSNYEILKEFPAVCQMIDIEVRARL